MSWFSRFQYFFNSHHPGIKNLRKELPSGRIAPRTKKKNKTHTHTAIQGFSKKKVNLFMYTWGIPAVGSFPVRLQSLCLPFWWGLAPSWVFLKYFPYFIIYCMNGFFWGTALSDYFMIFSTLFILTYMEGKFSGVHSSRVDFWSLSGIVSVAH